MKPRSWKSWASRCESWPTITMHRRLWLRSFPRSETFECLHASFEGCTEINRCSNVFEVQVLYTRVYTTTWLHFFTALVVSLSWRTSCFTILWLSQSWNKAASWILEKRRIAWQPVETCRNAIAVKSQRIESQSRSDRRIQESFRGAHMSFRWIEPSSQLFWIVWNRISDCNASNASNASRHEVFLPVSFEGWASPLKSLRSSRHWSWCVQASHEIRRKSGNTVKWVKDDAYWEQKKEGNSMLWIYWS